MRINIPDCSTCINSDSLHAKYCTPQWKELINKEKTFTLYKKGQHVFKEGNQVFGVYFIHSGKVKVFKSAPNDKTHIVRLAKTGDILGHRGLGGKLYYPIGAAALVDTWICFIENEVFFKMLKENAELTFNLMLFYAQELKKSEARMMALAEMSVKNRVVEALLLINDVYGREENGKIFLDVMLSRQEIADIAGTTHEQVIRSLSEFKKMGLIDTEGKKIIILDYEGLSDMVSDYGFGYLS